MKHTIIEFIGPSGVGKTTFLDNFKKTIGTNWLSIDDIRKITCLKKNNSHSEVIKKILIEKKKNIEKLNRTEYQKKFIYDYFEEIIRLDFYVSCSKENIQLINDDGIFHNFSNEILCISKKNKSAIENLLLKRKIIYFKSSPENILNNLKKRHYRNPGASNDWYGYANKNSKSIQVMIEKFFDESEKIYRIVKSMGATVMTINLDEDQMDNLEKAKEFIERDQSIIQFLTKENFFRAAEHNDSKHWKTQPLENRWEYHEKSIEILSKLKINNPNEILEIGTVGIQLLPESESMDIEGYWNYEGKNPTYLHDARKFPWPPQKKYKAIVALRVFQYLAPYQEIAFKEARRLSDNLIIVVPKNREYVPKGMEDTKGITYDEFLTWNNQTPPDFYKEMNLGDFYHWNFKKSNK